MQIRSLLTAFCLAVLSSTLHAAKWEGPFGLQKGLTAEEMSAATKGWKRVEPYVYVFDSAPASYAGVSEYVSIVTPQTGLCEVTGAFQFDNASAYGDDVKKLVARLTEGLTQKYGEPARSFDFLRAGSVWTQPNDWHMSLYKKERVRSVFWHKGSAPTSPPMPNALSAIAIQAGAEDASSAFVDLTYQFDNYDACLAIRKQSDDAAL